MDDSPESRYALAAAQDLAQRDGLRLVLVHAFPYQEIPTWVDVHLPGVEAEYVKGLERKAAALGRRGLDVTVATGHGSIPEVVMAEVKALSADMIIVGTAGRRGLKRLLLGSVAHQVVLSATCPVLVVPHT